MTTQSSTRIAGGPANRNRPWLASTWIRTSAASAIALCLGAFWACVPDVAPTNTTPVDDGGAEAGDDGGAEAGEAGCESEAPGDGGCRLFHHDCAAPMGCYVDPSSNTTDANLYCATLGASGNGAPCTSPSDCAENLACLSIDGGAQCAFWCVIPGTQPPFGDCSDAGGACPPNYDCKAMLALPAWLGECIHQ